MRRLRTLKTHLKKTQPKVDYRAELLKVKGIGPKAADDIITVFPTMGHLKKGIKKDLLAFTANIDKALIEAFG